MDTIIQYVSNNLRHITDFNRTPIMTITSVKPCRLTRESFTHDKNSYKSIRAVDKNGHVWYGRGSAMIAIKLRMAKIK